MSAQKAGLKFEKDVAAAVEEDTGELTRVVFGGGTSGNVRIPQPDLHITHFEKSKTSRECDNCGAVDNWDNGVKVYNIEIKRSTADRFYVEAEDFEQLRDCCNRYTTPVFMMKFTHREPVVVVFASLKAVNAHTAALELPACFNPHVTKSGSLRLDKPDTGQWQSSQGGRKDHEVLMEDLDIV